MPRARSRSSAPVRPVSPPPTSLRGWATSRSCSRPSPRPAACWSRPSQPTACRVPARARDQDDRVHGRAHRVRQGAREGLHAPEPPGRGLRGRVRRRRRPAGAGIGVPGEDGPGVYDGLSFLKEYNVSGNGEVGKNVAVIGGGNAAIDAARTALRLGAESVRILYRRTRAQMPAWGEEIDAADLEGIDIMTLVAPEEILRDASGKVTGVRCKEMALGDYDRSGRRRPVAGHNPDFVVEADTSHRRDRAEARRAGRAGRHPRRAQPLGLPRRRPGHRPDLASTGCSRAATRRPVRRRWSRRSAPARRPPSRSTSSSPAPTTPSGAATSSRRRSSTPTPTRVRSTPRGRGTGRRRPRHQLRRGRAELGRGGRGRRGEALPALRLRQVRLVSKES